MNQAMLDVPSKLRLLLVEDDPVTRRALQVMLSRRGWQVTIATTLADALAKLDPQPDAIVLDLMLPDGDGVVLLRRVRQLNLGTRVIVTTGVSDWAHLQEISHLHPEAMLQKPIELSQLCSILEG